MYGIGAVTVESFTKFNPNGAVIIKSKANGLTATGDRNGMRKHPEKILRGQNHYLAKHPETRRGVLNGRSKISEEQVIQIKQRLQNGESPTNIAKDFPITRETIYQIKSGRSWSHIK